MIALRKYSKTAAMSAASYVGDNPLFLLNYLLHFVRVAVLLALWRLILAGKGEVSGLTLPAVLTYTLLAEAFYEPLQGRTALADALWNGTIVTRLLHPVGTFAEFSAEALGRWGFTFCVFSLPLLAVAPLLGVSPLPASPLAGVLFVLSLGLAIAVGLAVDFVLGTAMTALELTRWALEQVRWALLIILSGALVPLALLPWGLGEVFGWLPFAAMASAPLRIYTGTGAPGSLLALQAGWALALWPLARWMWCANREKLVTHGG